MAKHTRKQKRSTRRRSTRRRVMRGGINWSRYQGPKAPTSTMGEATYGLRNMASRAKFALTPSNKTKETLSQATYGLRSMFKRNPTV